MLQFRFPSGNLTVWETHTLVVKAGGQYISRVPGPLHSSSAQGFIGGLLIHITQLVFVSNGIQRSSSPPRFGHLLIHITQLVFVSNGVSSPTMQKDVILLVFHLKFFTKAGSRGSRDVVAKQ